MCILTLAMKTNNILMCMYIDPCYSGFPIYYVKGNKIHQLLCLTLNFYYVDVLMVKTNYITFYTIAPVPPETAFHSSLPPAYPLQPATSSGTCTALPWDCPSHSPAAAPSGQPPEWELWLMIHLSCHPYLGSSREEHPPVGRQKQHHTQMWYIYIWRLWWILTIKTLSLVFSSTATLSSTSNCCR